MEGLWHFGLENPLSEQTMVNLEDTNVARNAEDGGLCEVLEGSQDFTRAFV